MECPLKLPAQTNLSWHKMKLSEVEDIIAIEYDEDVILTWARENFEYVNIGRIQGC